MLANQHLIFRVVITVFVKLKGEYFDQAFNSASCICRPVLVLIKHKVT